MTVFQKGNGNGGFSIVYFSPPPPSLETLHVTAISRDTGRRVELRVMTLPGGLC